MRLIDADALTWRLGISDDERQFFYLRSEDIDGAPTVEAVEAVRCRECCYCRHVDEWEHWCDGFRPGLLVRPEDYCSHGARKETQ